MKETRFHVLFSGDRASSPSHYFCFRLQRIEPLKDAAVAPPSRKFACLRPHSDAFKRFALCLQIGLGIVVSGVEADVPEPASDHRDVDAGRDQMYRSRMPEAVYRSLSSAASCWAG